MSRSLFVRFGAWPFLLVLFLTAAPATAQTTNWNIAGGGSWNLVGNWDSGVPTNTTTAVFGPNPTAAAIVTLDGAATALGLRMTNPGGLVMIDNGTGTNTLTLGANGIDMTTATQNLTINATAVALDAGQIWDVRNNRTLTVSSGIGLGSNTLTLNTTVASAPTSIALSGAIGGTGGLTLTGNGQTTLSGAGANTFTGPVNVNGGILIVSKAASTASTTINLSSGHIRWGASVTNALPATANLTLSGSASYNIASLNASGAIVFSSTGANHTQTYASFTHGATGMFTTGLNSLITVTGTFTHSGSGTLLVRDRSILSANALDLSTAGTTATHLVQMTGASTAALGVLQVGPGGIILNNRTVTLNTTAGAGALGSQIRLSGNLTNTGSTLITATVRTVPHSLSLENATRTISNSNFLNIDVPVVDGGGAGAGGIVVQGGGLTSIGRPSTYTGGTEIAGAGTRLRIGAANVLPDATAINLNGGTLLTGSTTGNSDVVGQLTLSASSTIALGTGGHVLNFAGLAASPVGTLSVTGWGGDPFSSGTAGRIVFNSNTNFSQTFLDAVQFSGFPQGAFLRDAGGGQFELTPVPEPTTVLAVAAAGLGLTGLVRRRLRRRDTALAA